MIVNMKFLTITGPQNDIDRIADEYLSKYEIQLENAISELKDVSKLRPFTGSNPYKEAYAKALEYTELLEDKYLHDEADMGYEQAVSVINNISDSYGEIFEKKAKITETLEKLKNDAATIFPFRNLEYDLNTILNFNFIKFCFGKMPSDQYSKFMKYIYDDLDVLFVKCMEAEGYVWGIYFVPNAQKPKIDAVFSSLHFEKTFIPKNADGTPNDIYTGLTAQIAEEEAKLNALNEEFSNLIKANSKDLVSAKNRLGRLASNYDLRKLAAKTNKEEVEHFILCGWASEQDSNALLKDLEKEPDIYCFVDDTHTSTLSTPPTKLKNPGIFKPFEMYIQMYGLPAYNELDPTIFVALTYSFIFGIMFGDVGQGLALFIGGAILYKLKKMNLAAIVSCCGIFSTLFGFMYGSIFGFEDILNPIWLKPGSHMSNLPFIGKMNTILVITIAFGMGVVLFSMILNIINSIKSKDIRKIFFDTNGLAGFVFYGSLALVIVLFMTGNAIPGGIVLAIMFGIPAILIALQEPITNKLLKKHELIEGSVGMFIVQTFFELFEICLSYLSNTISFVRVGAFAISHGAMMEVVLMLAGYESGNTNWLVVILGNLFVCGMEGLIVGIQVLRLEYYEMFSRFYKGTGREFIPYKIKK